jgi:5-methyltetrahydropteroyltriglutamate--homocysteine methyltransferase
LVHATVVGSYPRVDDSPEGQHLRRAIARWERRDLPADGLRAVQVGVLKEVVREQAATGIDLVTDGHVTWDDSQSHFASRLDGFEIGALERYFDTNTYYRRPRANGTVRWRSPITVDDYREAVGASPAPVKAVVTGPYTLAALSEGGTSETSPLMPDLAAALGREIEALAAAGARDIQVDEPAFVRRTSLPKGYEDAAAKLVRGRGRARTWLSTYFGGVESFLDDLLSLPFDGFGFDLVQGARTGEALRGRRIDKPVALGLVDARNTKLEDPHVVAKQALAYRDHIPFEDSFLSPSNGLEFLPRAKAREKLRVLVSAAKLASEGAQ